MLSNVRLALYFFLLSLLSSPVLHAREAEEEHEEPPHIHNFSLPGSQQISPLISFGQNIIDEGIFQAGVAADRFVNVGSSMEDILGGFLLGVTDDFSLWLNVPFDSELKQGGKRAAGWEEVYLQGEYSYYNGQTKDSQYQATILANVTFPTGVADVDPGLGSDAFRFFLGTTAERTFIDLYLFTSAGAILPVRHHGSVLGTQWLYQAGIGHHVWSGNGWYLGFLVEADGTYSEPNRIDHQADPDSGGNIITITPSFFVASEDIEIQFGAGFYALQRLKGDQDREQYFLSGAITWTFY